MELEAAVLLVRDYLRRQEAELNSFGSALQGYENLNIKLKIVDESTEHYDFGWVFYYASVYPGDRLGGNAPLLVNKLNGELIVTGTAREASFYITNYIKTGDVNGDVG